MPKWTGWEQTRAALSQTYYAQGFPPSEQQYALAALVRFATTWQDIHGVGRVPLVCLDAAAANEVWYHHMRAREFRRPCAALGACWCAIVSERPERVFDRHARMQRQQIAAAKKREQTTTPRA